VTLILPILLSSCSTSGGEAVKPEGNEQALPVYIQAYQENYAPDSMDLIVREAQNAYILLDPFSEEDVLSALPLLKKQGNQVSAYISIGTGEDWRSDFDQLQPYLTDIQWDDWEGEYYLSRLDTEVLNIMKARIDRIADWGFDWVEFDNMDWIFDEQTRTDYALEATESAGLAYIQALREYAADRGLQCMAKNMRAGADNFDGVTYESYSDEKNWWETEDLKEFLNEGKPGIIVHYNEVNCDAVYLDYMEIYGESLSFIAESRSEKTYIHYNQ